MCRLSGLERVGLILGAVVHDVGHPGRNNNYCVSVSSVLARIYCNVAVLENYHSLIAFRYAQISNEVNIFQHLEEKEYRFLRATIIGLILATDMAAHFSSISKFRMRRESGRVDPETSVEDRQTLSRLCVKLADLSHSLFEWPQHLEWSLRVTREFYLQGDLEQTKGLPISPLCDSNSHQDFAKSQSGFLTFVVLPLAEELSELDDNGAFKSVCHYTIHTIRTHSVYVHTHNLLQRGDNEQAEIQQI